MDLQQRESDISSATARPLTVGISGGSASGKTTLALALLERLAAFSPVHLNQDRYFRDFLELPESQREQAKTSNHPRAVLWEALVDHVCRLQKRESVWEPVEGTRARNRGVEPRAVEPSDLIIVEGHLLFTQDRVRRLLDLKLFVEADPHERVLRRMLRDTERGGMNLAAAIAWYRRDVIPNYPVHTAPTRRHADLVVPFDRMNDGAIGFLADGVQRMLKSRRNEASTPILIA